MCKSRYLILKQWDSHFVVVDTPRPFDNSDPCELLLEYIEHSYTHSVMQVIISFIKMSQNILHENY